MLWIIWNILSWYFLDLVQCLVCWGAQQKIPQNFPGKRSPQNDPGGKIWSEHWALDSQMGQVQSLFNFCHTSIVQVKKGRCFFSLKLYTKMHSKWARVVCPPLPIEAWRTHSQTSLHSSLVRGIVAHVNRKQRKMAGNPKKNKMAAYEMILLLVILSGNKGGW